ncbi:MAG TPA: hypothetical protein VIR33_14340 [Thermopolyspora sp.]
MRVGVAGGLVGMLCCLGPTALALIGVVGAGTAYAWASTLYGGYAPAKPGGSGWPAWL